MFPPEFLEGLLHRRNRIAFSPDRRPTGPFCVSLFLPVVQPKLLHSWILRQLGSVWAIASVLLIDASAPLWCRKTRQNATCVATDEIRLKGEKSE